MLDNRALVDHILTCRGVSAVDRERVCGDESAVQMLAGVIGRAISPDPIDAALREYWASQKVSGSDEDDE